METETKINDYLQTFDDYLQEPSLESKIDDYLQTEPVNTFKDYLQEPESKIDAYLEKSNIVAAIDNYLSLYSDDGFESNIDKILSDTHTNKQEKTRALLQILKKEIATGSWDRALKYLKSNWKSIIFNSAVSTGTVILLVVGYVYADAGSWSLLLNSLEYFGVNVLPGILLTAVKSAGISVIGSISISGLLKLAKTNKKLANILQSNVDNKYLKYILTKFGVTKPRQQTRENLMKILTQQAISLSGVSGILGLGYYTISTGLVKDVILKTTEKIKESFKKTKTRNIVGTIITENEKIHDIVADTILNNPQHNLYQNLNDNIKGLPRPELEPQPEQTLDKKLKIAKSSSINKSLLNIIKENKKTGYVVSFTVISTILAVTGNYATIGNFMKNYVGEVLGLAKVGELALKASDVMYNHPIATTSLVNLILKNVGIDKIIAKFGLKNTTELKNISSALRKERNQNRLYVGSKRFLSILLNGEYYTLNQLNRFNLNKIRNLYRRKYPQDRKYKLRTKKDLIIAIKKAVDARFFKLTELVSGFSKNLISGVVSGLVVTGLTTGLQLINKNIKKLRAFSKAQNKKILQQELELDKLNESKLINDIKLAKLERGLAERRVSLQKGQEFLKQQKIEALKLKARFLANKQTIQNLQKKIKLNIKKYRARKVEAIKAKDLLKKQAFENDLARKMDIAVTDTTGLVRPLPPEDVYMPKELKEKLNYQFTPLFQQLEEYMVTGVFDYIPLVGWVNKVARTTNIGLKVGEKLKDIGKINYILTQLEKGETDIDLSKYDMRDFILQQRLPTIKDLVGNVYKTDVVNMAELVRDKIRDGLLEGWDKDKIAFEIGKEVIGKAKSFQLIDKLGQLVKGDTSFKITNEIGGQLWKLVSG